MSHMQQDMDSISCLLSLRCGIGVNRADMAAIVSNE